MAPPSRERNVLGVLAAAALAAGCSGETATDQVHAPSLPIVMPDNPCDLLSARDVELATGLEVFAARRAQSLGDTTGDGSMCGYETPSVFGVLSIGYYAPDTPPDSGPNCTARTAGARSLAENYRGGGLIICLAPHTPIAVSMQHAGGAGSLEVLVGLAQAVLDHVPERSVGANAQGSVFGEGYSSSAPGAPSEIALRAFTIYTLQDACAKSAAPSELKVLPNPIELRVGGRIHRSNVDEQRSELIVEAYGADGGLLPRAPIIVSTLDAHGVTRSRSDWDYLVAVAEGEAELIVESPCQAPRGTRPVESVRIVVAAPPSSTH